MCERHVNLLVCSLPLHRHSYVGFILPFISSIHKDHQCGLTVRTKQINKRDKSVDHSRTTQFFLIPWTHLPLWEMSGGVRGKEHEWSYKSQDGQELKSECLGMTWSENVENRHWCFQNDHTHHMLQMVWKWNCTDSSRIRTKWFCRWIVVCFVCAHESSYVGGLSCVSCVCTKVHMSTRTCV